MDDEDGDTVAQGMLEAAEKYDIQDLKGECETFLSSKLNASNVGHLLLLADFHSADALKGAALEYMSGKMKQLVDTPVFDDIVGNAQLSKELFRVMAEKMESE